MKEVTQEMIRMYKIDTLGFDFMGYMLQEGDIYTYHHNIIARREGGRASIQNGAILCGKSSHPYLHVIESIDPLIFSLITSEMIDENIKGYLDKENLKNIRDLLLYFEKEHQFHITRKGHLLIKKEYKERRIEL